LSACAGCASPIPIVTIASANARIPIPRKEKPDDCLAHRSFSPAAVK
jgi:hypothetical protein